MRRRTSAANRCISLRTGSPSGAGQAMTLRFTSPQPPRVVSNVSLMPRMVARRFVFTDAVKLNALPSRQAQRVVAVLRGELVERQILLGREQTAGQFQADHAHIVLGDPRLGAIFARVAIFLLIAAVKLQQVLGVVQLK